MEQIILDAELRGVGRHPLREERNRARVPAVVYGVEINPQAIAIDARELQKALRSAGTGLMTLRIAGQEPLHVLARETQRHTVKHNLLHVDFQAVSMTQKLRLHVPVVAEGIAPAMKLNADLVLVRVLDAVEVECLPTDIPNHLVADLSKLASEHDEIVVSDLALPAGVKAITAHDHVLLSLTRSRAGALEETPEAAATTTEVEVALKGKAAKEDAEVAPAAKK